jgi:hypothetical protein
MAAVLLSVDLGRAPAALVRVSECVEPLLYVPLMYPESVGLGEEPCMEDVIEGLDTELREPGLVHAEDGLTQDIFTINQSQNLRK